MNKTINYREIAEYAFFKDLLSRFPKGILSLVSDTFDLFTVITEFLPRLKPQIMARDGKLVIRPDSGDPVDIICGLDIKSYDSLEDAMGEFEDDLYSNTVHGEPEFTIDNNITVKVGDKYYQLTEETDWNRHDKQYYFAEEIKILSNEIPFEPKFKGVIELLWDIFGGIINEQGYKVLDPHIGAIYGDSITLERQVQIYERLATKGFASTNIVLGIGSYTYQMNTRDTLGFAAKGAWFEVEENGVRIAHDIYKDPITDDGTKKSLKGLIMVDENHEVHTQCTWEQEAQGILQTIYQNGEFFHKTTLTEIRERLSKI